MNILRSRDTRRRQKRRRACKSTDPFHFQITRQKKSSSKRRRIRQDKWIASLALKLSQKHLAQAEESNCLELTTSAAIHCDPRAGRGRNTTNKNSQPTSKPVPIDLKDVIKSDTNSNYISSLALRSTAQPPTKKVRLEPDATSVAQGGETGGIG